jgi:hypothetical protein
MEKLKANWGIPAETMECFAEARLLDPSNGWEAYLLALSDDEDTFVCLIMGKLEQVPTSALIESCNNCGEYLQIDKSFRRRQAKEIYKKMNEGKWINEI